MGHDAPGSGASAPSRGGTRSGSRPGHVAARRSGRKRAPVRDRAWRPRAVRRRRPSARGRRRADRRGASIAPLGSLRPRPKQGREVDPGQAASFARGRQTAPTSPRMGGVRLGDDQQAGRVLVQPMDDARPLDAADAREARAAMGDERIDERTRRHGPAPGWTTRPAGLSRTTQVRILEQDVERHRLPRGTGSAAGGTTTATACPAWTSDRRIARHRVRRVGRDRRAPGA